MTQKIFIIGAGRSASSLIKYLINVSVKNNFELTIGDKDVSLVKDKIDGHKCASAIRFDVFNDDQRISEIKNADIVISMLPATLHFIVAKDCLKYKKNLVTASYVSKDIQSLNDQAQKQGVILLNEIGLDPGIDHMSAMKVIDDIKNKGGIIKSFKSYCGGLVAPEYDTNPWNYKFTWNPRNVVLAGQGTAQYIDSGKYKYIPYGQLFKRTDTINVLNYGQFEAYANRDSLSYREVYKLNDIPTLFRGTLRKPGYSEAWDLFVQMGMTDDSYEMDVSGMNYSDFFNSFIDVRNRDIKSYLKSHFRVSDDVISKVEWLGFFNQINLDLEKGTPAQILQKILESKWLLKKEDKDMIVMQHQFIYEIEGKEHELHSSFVLLGEDQTYTGMAKTVGLPVGIATKLILNGEIKSTGVKVPVSKDIYKPVLEELEQYGIRFVEEEIR
ncbi:MAG: saccharopine dehydrogenase family protein [Flavobacteriales bacterium]